MKTFRPKADISLFLTEQTEKTQAHLSFCWVLPASHFLVAIRALTCPTSHIFVATRALTCPTSYIFVATRALTCPTSSLSLMNCGCTASCSCAVSWLLLTCVLSCIACVWSDSLTVVVIQHTERLWNLKCMIIPVKTGATGIVTESLRKYLEAILRTSHIIRIVLQCETWSLSSGSHCWFKRSSGKKRSVTRDNDNNNNCNQCTGVFKKPVYVTHAACTLSTDVVITLVYTC
jgi:hypothetical protein